MPDLVFEFLDWLEGLTLADTIRDSLWLYPALEIIHLVGIVLLVGAAFMFDLRLLGFSKSLQVVPLSAHLLPWSRRGLLLIIPSGFLLFITNARTLGTDSTFWLKMTLLVFAALNVFVFHRFVLKADEHLNKPNKLPFQAKISAIISISVWIAIISCGRLLAY